MQRPTPRGGAPRLLPALVLLALGLPAAGRADIVITEIHYAPTDPASPDVSREDLEFVELFNDGPEVFDLSGFYFSRGLTYEFPEASFIEGRSRVVVCRDSAAVAEAYDVSGDILFGDFEGALDNSGERVELANPQGRAVTSVRYNDRGQWPSGAKRTGHSLSLRYEYTDPDDADSWALSTRMGGSPGQQNFASSVTYEERTIIATDEVWRYLKGTAAPPADWNEPEFDDGDWLEGRTGIGYGDGDDRTELDDMRYGYLTVFCRRTFQVDDPAEIDSLVLSVVYDDGFHAYLNGHAVGSVNVSGRSWDDTADGAGEPETAELDISAHKSRLVSGDNVLAVQVHNGNLDSSDLSFIPSLLSRRAILPEEIETVPVVVNEAYLGSEGERFIELFNKSDAPVDLSGYTLSDELSDLGRFRIADSTSIAGRGFLVFTEADLGFDLSIVEGVRERISIALTNPAGTRVVDARILEHHVEGTSEARYPDGDEKFTPAAVPTPGAPNEVDVPRNVIFNEIHYHPISEDERDEFIELYNRGDVAQDLSGWVVEGVGMEFPPGTVVEPGEYLVIAADPERIRATYGLDASVVVDVPWEGRLANGGERLRLVDGRGVTSEQVRYRDGGEWPTWADGLGSSLERVDPLGDGDVGTTWDASDDSEKSETQTFTYTATYRGGESDFGLMLMEEGIAVVDDLQLVRTTGGGNLISNAGFESSTSGWRIEGTHIRSGRTDQAEEVISGGGSLKVISWHGTGDYKVNRIETNTSAQQSGSTYRISLKARWIVGGRTLLTIGDYTIGNSTANANAGLAGANRFTIPDRLGTPGAENSVSRRQVERSGDTNQGPSITGVSHSPPVPIEGQEVTVRARVRDPDGIAAVSLEWRAESPSGSFNHAVMTDPDGDGRYTATIPGHDHGTRIVFRVVAVDVAGRDQQYPRDPLRFTHPPVVDPLDAGPSEGRYCIYRHDNPAVSTSYHAYRFIMDEDRERELAERRVLSNHTLEGTLVFGTGDVYYNASLRFAGSPWLRPSGGTFQKSYVIKLPKDRPLHGRKGAFSLDEHGTDGRERIAHYLLRRGAGTTPLPYFDRHALARFQLNDVHDGTYEEIQRPNREYMSFWFPSDRWGAHYEMDDRFSFNDSGSKTGNAEGKVLAPPYGSTAGGNDKENYRWYFALRDRKGDDDFGPIMSLCRLMDTRTTSTGQFDAAVFDTIDVEEFLRVWAIRLHIDDWDTWGGNRGKNCYFYQSPSDALWRLVPWDLELTFGNVNAFSLPSSPTQAISNHYTEVARMLNRPRIRRLYYGILQENIDTFFSSATNSPLRRYTDRLSGSGVGVGSSVSFVGSRSSLIRSWIRGAFSPTIRFQITTNGGDDFHEDGDRVMIAGDAPANVFSFAALRGGEILDDPAPIFGFSSTRMEDWSTWIQLVPGANEIEILGFDGKGEFVASDSIVVTSTPPWSAPIVHSLGPDPAMRGEEITILGEELHDGLKLLFGGLVEVTDVDFDETTDPERIRAIVPEEVLGSVTTVEVINSDGQRSEPWVLRLREEVGETFLRGDANVDGTVDISDAIRTLSYLFLGATAPCLDGLDTDDSGLVDLTDAVVTLGFLFQGGPSPRAPYPEAGPDPTDDDLGCDASS